MDIAKKPNKNKKNKQYENILFILLAFAEFKL